MRNNEYYPKIKFLGIILSLVGGGFNIALGMQGEWSFLFLGAILIVLGVSLILKK
ncbi:MAG: hypothetical protein MUP45_03585 [Candidatus Marinimicrobia bacterium]|nr:hypothetical protein [Candidatus Neomarinimicrobiota bacterium]